MRRCLGPVGGSVAFFLVAGLVFAGLGWVTVAALRVEDAQRAAAAEAAVANTLRVALWRLDGRLLPALGAENARTFLEYAPPDTESAYGPTCAPLLAAPLPDWMRLHAQLDPDTGWSSPQVLTPEASELFKAAWPELTPGNATRERARALDALQRRHPFKAAYAAFAARDGLPLPTEPARRVAEAPRMPAPAAFGGVNAPTPAPTDQPAEREQAAPATTTDVNGVVPAPPPRPVTVATEQAARGTELRDNRGEAQSRKRTIDLAADARQPSTYIYPAQNYRQNIDPQAGTTALGRNPTPTNPALQNGYAANGRPGGPNDRDGSPVVGTALAAKGAAPGGGATAAEGGASRASAAPSLGGLVEFFDRSLKKLQEKDELRADDAAKAKLNDLALLNRAKEERKFGPAPAPAGPGGFGGGVGRGGAGDATPAAPPGAPAAGPAGQAAAMKQDRAAPPPPVAGRAAPLSAPKATAATAPPQLPTTPDPAPAPLLQPADAAPAPVVVFNMPPVAVHLGPVRPQWLAAADGTDTLVLVRTARLDGRTVYQGVELNWPRLQEVLRDDIKDLFPDAQLVPVKAGEGAPDRAMTALPVQLDPGPAPAPPPVGWSPLRIGLALAWAAAVLAFGAIGLAGWSLIDLSERRFRFVSAVTHELRTPLTSLRLYLDLLLSGMVQDEQKRTEYLSTLAVESDRLHRLVDNVLDFARLERRRGGGALKPAKVADLLAAVRDTWTDRCGTDGKELIVVSTLPPEAEVTTDAALVGQIVGNLIDNARKYARGASDPRVWVWAKPEGRKVVLEVEDRGPGVAPRERALIFRPFRRGETADTTAGGAGLGLALCKQWAESLGGTLGYRPADGPTGACFRLELPAA